MDTFEEKVELLKYRLEETLIELDGKATLRQFGYNFRKKYGIVNLQPYGLDKFSQLIQNFSDTLVLSFESKDWWVCMQHNHKSQTESSKSLPQQPPITMNSVPAKDKVLFSRFLIDCETSLNEKEYIHKNVGTSSQSHPLQSSSVPSDKHTNVNDDDDDDWSSGERIKMETEDNGVSATGSKEKEAKGLNPFFETEFTEINDIQPEIFLLSDEGTSSVKSDATNEGFFNFGKLDEELIVGGFPQDENASNKSTILKDLKSPPMSDFSSEYFEYKMLNDDSDTYEDENLVDEEDSEKMDQSNLDIMSYHKFEDNFASDNHETSIEVNSETTRNENRVEINTALSLKLEVDEKVSNSDEYISPETLKTVVGGFENQHIEDNQVADLDVLIQLEREIETLDVIRDGKSSNTPSSSIIDKQRQMASFETLSSLESSFDQDDNNDDEDCIEEDDEGPRTVNEMLASLPFDAPIFYNNYPPHNRDSSVVLPKLNTEKSFKNQSIFITEINSPSHFWFQLEENYTLWIDMMQQKINKAYRRFKSKDLRISNQNYLTGLLVAAFHPIFKEWYRAQINIVKKKSVHLFFIDYGTHVYIQKKYVKYLLNDFLEFPKACDRGRIYGVVPSDGKQTYSPQAMDLFITKLTDEKFLADLAHYDEEEDVYGMNVKFTKNDQDIAECMIEDKICEKAPKDEHCAPLLTHELLEKGTHPSFEQTWLTYQQQEITLKECQASFNL